MKIAAVIFVVICVAGCATKRHNMIVLKYHDFGPQTTVHQILGMEWWQWDNHGYSDPDYQYDIKVVVYRDISLSEVERAYPVVKEKEQDFRYISYSEAINYLDTEILKTRSFLPELSHKMTKTKEKIVIMMGKPNE